MIANILFFLALCKLFKKYKNDCFLRLKTKPKTKTTTKPKILPILLIRQYFNTRKV